MNVSIRSTTHDRVQHCDTMSANDPRQEHWVRDTETTRCYKCEKPFHLVTCRRHHCRRCGQAFCHECSDMRIALPETYGYGNQKVRTCQDCSLYVIQHDSAHSVDDLSVLLHINTSLKKALGHKTQLLERCRALLLLIDSFNGLSGNRVAQQDSATCVSIVADSKSSEVFDDDEDNGGLPSLLTRCEQVFQGYAEEKRQYHAAKVKLEERIQELDSLLQLRTSSLTELHGVLQKAQADAAAQISATLHDRDALQIIIGRQQRLIQEQESQLAQLSSRCCELQERHRPNSTNEGAIFSEPKLMTRGIAGCRVTLPEPSWGVRSLGDRHRVLTEPLLLGQEACGGSTAPISFISAASELRNQGPQEFFSLRSILYCCCCKRRRRTTPQ